MGCISVAVLATVEYARLEGHSPRGTPEPLALIVHHSLAREQPLKFPMEIDESLT